MLGGAAYTIRKHQSHTLSIAHAEHTSNIVMLFSFTSICFYFVVVGHVNGAGELIFSFLSFLILIFTRDKAGFSCLLTNRAFMFLGTISYSFYLIHLLVITLNMSENIFGVTCEISSFFVHFTISLSLSFIWFIVMERLAYERVKIYIDRTA